MTPGSTWDENSWQLEEALAAAHKKGVQAVVMVYVSEDNKNNTLHRLVVRSRTSIY